MTDLGQNAVDIAVMANHYSGDVNAVSFLIETGCVEVSKENTWHELLMYNLSIDTTNFFRLAY